MNNFKIDLTIYNFKDYRAYVQHIISQLGLRRGTLTQLATEAGCHSSYLSQVLKGTVHLSQDQVFGIASAIGLTDEETDYFFALLSYARAATPKLRFRISSQLEVMRNKAKAITQLLDRGDSILSEVDQSYYYSSWVVSAVHVCTDIPGLQSVEAISLYLQIPRLLVSETLNRLLTLELVQFKDRQWKHSGKQSHVDKQSPYFMFHRINWQQQANLNCMAVDHESVHFSGVYAVDETAYQEIKEKMLAALKSYNKVALGSQSRRVMYFCADMFWVR